MIIIDSCTTRYKDVNFTLYGIDIITVALLEYARDLLKGDTHYQLYETTSLVIAENNDKYW